MRTLEPTPERAAQGKALFAACGACHGVTGEGRTGIGPRLASDSFLAAASDDFLVRTIAKGRTGTTMIPWGASYDQDQIGSIVIYLRSLNPVPPVQLDESALGGNAAAGAPTFDGICAQCHGRSGGGYQESANGTGIGRKAFLDEVSNGYLRYVIKHGKTGTAMRSFSAETTATAVANLTEQQIDDVIAYLRSKAW